MNEIMDFGTYAAFALAFFVFGGSPGPDNITIFSKTLNDGPAHGMAYGCGVVLSIFCFVILTALGFNAISTHIGDHLHFIRYIGAAYLVYTGIAMWRASPTVASRQVKGNLTRLFFTRFLLNTSNPKMPIFYLALLPSTLGIKPLSVTDTLVVITIVFLTECVVTGTHVLIALKAKTAFSQPKRVRALNRSAGALMIGAGVVVAAR